MKDCTNFDMHFQTSALASSLFLPLLLCYYASFAIPISLSNDVPFSLAVSVFLLSSNHIIHYPPHSPSAVWSFT